MMRISPEQGRQIVATYQESGRKVTMAVHEIASATVSRLLRKHGIKGKARRYTEDHRKGAVKRALETTRWEAAWAFDTPYPTVCMWVKKGIR